MQVPASRFHEFDEWMSYRTLLAFLKDRHGSSVADDIMEAAYEAFQGKIEVPRIEYPKF